ncbi:glycosyltransferase family 2 protein [Spirillospora sp. NPDC050679]
MRTAVITLAAGRHAHLRRQQDGLAAGVRRPDHYVVAAMGDPAVRAAVEGRSPAPDVLEVPADRTALPLAEARNAGARRALDAGAELLVFLDVDCVPGPDLLERYHQAAAGADAPALLCGTVAYLPPPPEGGYRLADLPGLADPHPARPAPAPGGIDRDGDHRLFWSLSFAVTAATWRAIGGFDEAYTGYGGEDTDFGQRARRAGAALWWVGGAPAFHQYHPSGDPPVRHLDDILRNAEVFHRRWGWWPMTGWLESFAELGLARFDERAGRWVRSG